MRKFILSPYLISTIILIAGFFMLPMDISNHRLVESDLPPFILASDHHLFACDLDQNGTSEYVKYKLNILGEPSVVAYYLDQEDIQQWDFFGNFRSDWVFYAFDDYDNNGFSEVYLMTVWQDSVYLNFVEPFNPQGAKQKSIAIAALKSGTSFNDIKISLKMLVDINHDGYKEALIKVEAGFTLEPREVIIVDIKTSEISSYRTGYNPIDIITSFDIDNDNLNETFIVSRYPKNMDSVLSATQEDIVVKFLFVEGGSEGKLTELHSEYSGNEGGFFTMPLINDRDTFIAGLGRSSEREGPFMMLWDNKGKFLDSADLVVPEYKDEWSLRLLTLPEPFDPVWITNEGYVYKLTDKLIARKVGRYEPGWLYRGILDIDMDGKYEYLGLLGGSNFIVYDSKFKNSTSKIIQYNYNPYYRFHVSLLIDNGNPQILVQNDLIARGYYYKHNWWYYAKYPILILSQLFLWLVIYLIRKQQRIQIEKQHQAKEELVRYQFQAIANQINPHFNYNILNTIGYSILNEERNKAYELLVDYSMLTRSLIQDSSKMERSLETELDFVETYLRLQSSRFNDELEYSIDLDKNIDPGLVVPKLIIHTFIENSIKHGLAAKEGLRKISVRLKDKESVLEIYIDDNGIGREEARKRKSQSTGQGMEILDRVIKIYQDKFHRKVEYKIHDFPGPPGVSTRVIINIQF